MMAQRIYEQCITHRLAAKNCRKLKSVKLVCNNNNMNKYHNVISQTHTLLEHAHVWSYYYSRDHDRQHQCVQVLALRRRMNCIAFILECIDRSSMNHEDIKRYEHELETHVRGVVNAVVRLQQSTIVWVNYTKSMSFSLSIYL
jgi:hypothetical protein